MNRTFDRVLRSAAWLLTTAVLVFATAARAAPRGVDVVSVSAVNYSGRELNAVLFIDPENKAKVAGGPPIQPYGGSGAMCCYELPHKWRPGIKVKIRYDWWEGDVPRNFHFVTVDLPPYPTDEPGVLWALFYEDGSMEVFASAVDPGHPKWPGKIKSWPVPSREYVLKLWQYEYDRTLLSIDDATRMRNGLSDAELDSSWQHRQRYQPKTVAGFSGPRDPNFIEFVKREGARWLAAEYSRLKQLNEIKP